MTELFAWADGELVGKLVTRCALSRICGACGATLGRPVAFAGPAVEVDRNTFHAPPLHVSCAGDVVRVHPDWQVVETSGFEFVRPTHDDVDRRPTFRPNSLL